MWNQLAVVFLVRSVEAGLDDALPQRIQIRHQELLQLAGEKFPPLSRPFFIDIGWEGA